MDKNRKYTLMALSPFTIVENGKRRSFDAGGVFEIKGEDTANIYFGTNSPYKNRVVIISADKPIEEEIIPETKFKVDFEKQSETMNETVDEKVESIEADEKEVQPEQPIILNQAPKAKKAKI